MADINLHFVVPSTGRVAEIGLDDSMTSAEVIDSLIENNLAAPLAAGYKLRLKRTGVFLAENSTLQQSGLVENDMLSIVPGTEAGWACHVD